MNFPPSSKLARDFSQSQYLFSSLVAVSFAERTATSQQTAARVTFSHDIAAIVFRSCAPCHHAGEAGPFPLISYGDVKSHARQIADVTSKHLMPPWLPSQDGLRLEDDSHLSGEEIALFQKWVADGMLEGNRDEAPAGAKIYFWLAIGNTRPGAEGELHLLSSRQRQRCLLEFYFSLAVKFCRASYGRLRFIPEKNGWYITQIFWWIARSPRDAKKNPQEVAFRAWSCKSNPSRLTRMDISFFGSPAVHPLSNQLSWRCGSIRATTSLLNTHLQPSGKAESIQPVHRIYFTDQPATKFPVLLQLDNDRALDIPAGDTNFLVTDEFTLPGKCAAPRDLSSRSLSLPRHARVGTFSRRLPRKR